MDELGEITTCYAVTFKRVSKYPARRLWQALTQPDEIAVWMEGPAKVDLRVGGEWHVDFAAFRDDKSEDEGNLEGIITRLEPEGCLEYAWGTTICQWTFEDTPDGCNYTFLQSGLVDRGEGEEGLAAGWHGFVEQFERHLDGGRIPHDEGQRLWKARHAPYLDLLNAALVRTAPGVARRQRPGVQAG